MLRRLAHVLGPIALTLAAMLPAGAAWGQDCSNRCAVAQDSDWLGDLNSDDLVTDADVAVLETCFFTHANGLCPMAGAGIPGDFNFDAVIDDLDKKFLEELIDLAGPAGTPFLPRASLAEIRTGKPSTQTAGITTPSRYVELYCFNWESPASDPVVGDPNIRTYSDGWYYLKIARSTVGGTDPQVGTIAVVVPLVGTAIVSNRANDPLTVSRGRSLVADDSFVVLDPVDPCAPPIVSGPLVSDLPIGVFDLTQPDSTCTNYLNVLPPGQSLALPSDGAAGRDFVQDDATNVTHLLVYRNPNPTNPRPLPQVGQFIVPQRAVTADCPPLPWAPGAGDTTSSVPWNVIVDCISLVRDADDRGYGCVFAQTPDNANSLGPVGPSGAPKTPLHPFRCRNSNRLQKGAEAITPESDTPFARNTACSNGPIQDCGERNPDGTPRNCFLPNDGPYCQDEDCCLNVCLNFMPSCCETVWDQDCAEMALDVCTTCGITTADCFVPHPTPSCEDETCCNLVCGVIGDCCELQWDQACANEAREVCRLCGGSTTGPCDQPSTLPSCKDADCCNIVCGIDSTCCSVAWDARCVEIASLACRGCGGLLTGSCCIIHPTPFCRDPDCCVAVCTFDPFCCQTAWDLSCTQYAAILPQCEDQGCVCGNPAIPGDPFDCFASHALPGCEDIFCCQSTCLRDPFCCYVTWDEACVRVAEEYCSQNPGCFDPVTSVPSPGSCFVPHATPGCDSPGCCSQVCAIAGLEYCCETVWDADCAARAIEVCDDCGDPFAGSCLRAHTTPNCVVEECCRAVCDIDPFCCEVVWDGLCAETARTRGECNDQATCGGPPNVNRSCWIPSYTPGCTDATCCAIVSAIDPFCTEVRWDAVCAREAAFLCSRSFLWIVGTEGCLAEHASAGCSNADCSRAVCSVLPECCTLAWDIDCVLAAIGVCPNPESCPATGDCFASHGNAGCQDAACCNGVCAVDPECCDTLWDSTCATTANFLCTVPSNADWPCPCLGSCFEAHTNAGCDDGACCAVVCHISPVCCDSDWDADCVAFARTACCGSPGCGSGCNKPCLEPHLEPFCDDPYCCEAVCRADPLCCSATWDTVCVGLATQRCASACGLSPAGDCFIPHELPGCNQGKCCGAVCTIDSFCCETAWDDQCVSIADTVSDCVRLTCGSFGAGPPCFAHSNPASENEACCTLVCDDDPYCCDFEWDTNCVELARTFPSCSCASTCGDPCAGDCCSAHDNPSCENASCCDAVCLLDDYCCTVTWDAVCAQAARSICTGPDEACPLALCGDPSLQDCCLPSNAPNCLQSGCCTAVCVVDQFCCQTAWDEQCVALASDVSACDCSGDACGTPGSGSCFQPHGTPYCEDAGCCATVCQIYDASCCSVAWDEECVDLANFACLALKGGVPSGKARPSRADRVPPGWVPVRERAKLRNVTPLKPAIPVPTRGSRDTVDQSPAKADGPAAPAVPVAGPSPQGAIAAPSAPAKPGKSSLPKP